MVKKKSPIVYVSGRKFWYRLKTMLFLIILAGFVCFCLTLMKLDYNIIGYSSDYVSWFRVNRNISKFLRLDESTHLVSPSEISECFYDDVPVVYFVTTTPKHRIERNVIRSTWGKSARPRPIFITGLVEKEEDMHFLYEESKLYNDIIIEDFSDSYTNLTLKTGFIFKNFLRLCPNSAYLMKTDDDVLVNTTLIENIVMEAMYNDPLGKLPIIGRLYPPYKAHRDPESKWYLPHWMYGKDYLPAYISGTGYLVPAIYIEKILQSASQVPLLPLEDVYFLGLVANETAGVPLENNPHFVDVKPFFSHFCSYRKLATLHHLDAKEISNIWMNLHNEVDQCDGLLYSMYNYLFG
ncbi:unnamed protein product [Hermetia illucens]|uniref:Hexosyltransferase n=1 Tax=Hermetia illucens TaxID=343691 RepID=A0A7R8YSU0_HERIL|nr:beta-1,3-galactosyltransferase 1-like [Hermetia illucens]CAD7084217.1 unnamed protein product [Hermetia illucens]